MIQKITSVLRHNLKRFRDIPRWGWFYSFGIVLFGFALYSLAPVLRRLIGFSGFGWNPAVPAVDGLIPLVPSAVLLYVFSYYVWVKGYLAVSLTDRTHAVNLGIAAAAGAVLCFAVFFFFPTGVDREAAGLYAALEGPGFWKLCLRTVYRLDGGRVGPNLFPSVHVLHPVYAYLGLRRRPEISRGFRVYSLAVIFAVSASTVLTKQHALLDSLGAAAVAVLTYAVVMKLNPAAKIRRKRS